MFSKKIFLLLSGLILVQGLVIPNLDVFDFVEVLTPSVAKVEAEVQQLLTGDTKSPAPVINTDSLKDIIPHSYIVMFKPEVAASAATDFVQDVTGKLFSEVKDKVSLFNVGDLKGFSAYLPPAVLEFVQNSNLVQFIEPDSMMKLNEFDIQKEAPWGLSRISHRKTSNDFDYLYDNEGGKGVDAYVVDTGIKVEHEEFEGRAVWGAAIAFPKIPIDTNGHGTHCAGIIGSKTYGVAKGVNLYAVGVMNMLGMGSTSDIIKGLEYVVEQHKIRMIQKGFKGSTVNLSLGGGQSEAFDLAVNAAVNAGLHVAVAAGNDDKDACDYSPARATGPITVGATNIDDAKASFSNWGKCVDVFAPGEDIESTYIYGGTARLSGTSMASPHVAGLLSYYLSLLPEEASEYAKGNIDPTELKRKLIKYATKGVISGLDANSPNKLIYNGAGKELTKLWNHKY
jgi:cerevisin